jgi:hypothetical protein
MYFFFYNIYIMSLINIDELHTEQDHKQKLKEEVYEAVLKICHRRIIATSKIDNVKYCFFQVPSYIYGIPLYDFKQCILYLVTALNKNGFEIKYTHPNLLYISWLGRSNKDSADRQLITNRPPENTYNPINSYKPSNSLIYNKNSLDSLTYKKNNLFH